MAATGSKRKQQQRRRRKKQLLGLIALCICLGILAVVYLVIASYYGSHYFPHTQIAEIDCSNKTPTYVKDVLLDEAGSYLLTITDRTGQKCSLLGADISYHYESTGEEEDILTQQKNFLWPGMLGGEKTYDLHHSAVYDEEALERVVQHFSFMQPENMTPPTDATLTISDSGYDLVEETQGTTVLPEQVLLEIRSAIGGQRTELTLSDACYQTPAVTTESPEIQNLKTQLDHFMNATVTYELGDDEEEGLDGAEIASMLVISEDGQVSLDEQKVTDYVQDLAYRYNTYGDVREFQTTMGGTVEIGGGDYGWVVDKAGETAQLLTDLNGGTPVTREMVYEQRAIEPGIHDIGNTYIEIDYTNQHLFYYKDGTLVTDTDVVTGNISKNNGSPDGVFKIVYKKSPAVLVGENYASDVTYFMPFAYNVGIHDADWRSSFGGNIYKTSGSHGCVNAPKEAAAKLYEDVEVGTPVIAYYREPIVLTAENAKISNAFSYNKEAAEEKAAQQAAAQAAADAAAAQAAAEAAAAQPAEVPVDPAAVPQ